MKMIKLPTTEQVYRFLKKYSPWILALVFIIVVSLNALIYHRYVYSTISSQTEPEIKKTLVDYERLNRVLDDVDMRQNNLFRVKRNYYNDPFN